MKLKKFLSTSSFILISTPALAGLGDPYDTVVMCRACPAGTSGNGSATSCTNCTAGTYQDNVGQGKCKNCASNTDSTNFPGVKTCNRITGYAESCNKKYYKDGNVCKICEEGYMCPGDDKRHQCAPGTFAKGTGNETCSNCDNPVPMGNWLPAGGQSYAECGYVKKSATAYCQEYGSKHSKDQSYNSTVYDTLTCSSDKYCEDGKCTGCRDINNATETPVQSSTYHGYCNFQCYSGYPYHACDNFSCSSDSDVVACCKNPAPTGGHLNSSCGAYCLGRKKLVDNKCVECTKPSNAKWNTLLNGCEWSCKSGYTEDNGKCCYEDSSSCSS